MNRFSTPTLAWTLLGVSAICLAALTLFSIYREEQGNTQRRSELLSQQQIRLTEKLADYFSKIQLQTARRLVSFHNEGLQIKLDQWQKSDPLIENVRISPPQADLQTFLNTTNLSTLYLESPDAPSSLRNGYYQDNKEIALRQEGRIDPIIFWYFEANEPSPSWTVGHRVAKGQAIRIAKLDTEALISAFGSLLNELAIPGLHSQVTLASIDDRSEIANILPGYALKLTLEPNSERKKLNTLSYSIVTLTLAIGILCSVLIARQTANERREALRKTTFVSQISHEFKTPLTSISLYSDLLSNDSLPIDKRNKYLDTISRESLRLSEMVDNILALNAIESGKKKYRIRTLDLSETVSSILSDYQPTLESSGIQINWARPSSPAKVRFDPAALRQILLNLLDNARKYAGDGKVIELRIATGESCQLIVQDDGPGVPTSLREQIFETFFQQQKTLIDKSPGAGIGLSISRRLARDCQGDLKLDASYKQGARFVLELPLEKHS